MVVSRYQSDRQAPEVNVKGREDTHLQLYHSKGQKVQSGSSVHVVGKSASSGGVSTLTDNLIIINAATMHVIY